MSDDEWLNTDLEASQATGFAAAELLHSVATALEKAPEEKRYDIEIQVRENDA